MFEAASFKCFHNDKCVLTTTAHEMNTQQQHPEKYFHGKNVLKLRHFHLNMSTCE